MTLAFTLFSRLCEMANALDAMREQYPGGSTPHEVLTAVVESLDTSVTQA